MGQKILMLVIVWSCMLAYDGPKLKKQQGGVKAAYAFFAIVAVYLSCDYLFAPSFPSLDEAVNWLLKIPAKRIVSALSGNIP